MAMTGFICHDDYYDRLLRLSDEEVGHLFRQLMLYHAGRTEEMTDFIGMEGLAFDFISADIDRMEEKYTATSETNRLNGSKGGRPKKQPKPNETEENRQKPTETEENRTKAYKDKEKDKDIYIDDDNARAIAAEQSQVLDAAEDAGFKMSNDVRDSLIALYAENGLQKMLDGMRSCVEHGAPNLAYLKACLRDEPRKRTASKMLKAVNAQLYEQRDYSGEQAEAMNRMISQMEASV